MVVASGGDRSAAHRAQMPVSWRAALVGVAAQVGHQGGGEPGCQRTVFPFSRRKAGPPGGHVGRELSIGEQEAKSSSASRRPAASAASSAAARLISARDQGVVVESVRRHHLLAHGRHFPGTRSEHIGTTVRADPGRGLFIGPGLRRQVGRSASPGPWRRRQSRRRSSGCADYRGSGEPTTGRLRSPAAGRGDGGTSARELTGDAQADQMRR